jgi:hypothetical protein
MEAGSEGGVERQATQADKEPGTGGGHDDGRILHTASEDSERQGRRMNGQELCVAQQFDTSFRAIGPRNTASGSSGVGNDAAGGSTSGTTNARSGGERRLPRVILKVKPPPGAGEGMGRNKGVEQ